MSPTPEKARKCRSRSSFPGEESYRCVVRGEHVMHTDGRHHNWFDAIPDLPISAYQADFLEQLLEPGATPPGFKRFGGVSSAETFVEMQAPRLAQFEVLRGAFASPFRQLMEAATKGGDEVAKKKIEDLHLPKVEYTYREGTNTLVPADPEAAKVDHVMTRHGGEIFGIARVSKEPTPLAEAHQAEALEKLVAATSVPRGDRAVHIASGEVRTTSSTGGQKGMKPARFDLIPVMPLTRLAELYAAGAAKYDDHQWRKGYELSKSYAAAQRHLTAFWGGEDNDPELGTPHLASVMWHAMAMMQILEDFPQHDDRYKKEA